MERLKGLYALKARNPISIQVQTKVRANISRTMDLVRLDINEAYGIALQLIPDSKLYESFPIRISAQECAIANDDKKLFCSRDGNVHPKIQ